MQLIRSLLHYDKSNASNAIRGRCLLGDIPTMGLRKRDRLEPSVELPDTGDLHDGVLPLVQTFWRRSEETMVRHRSPLLKDPYVARVELASVDEMHTMHLGVYNTLCWSGVQRTHQFRCVHGRDECICRHPESAFSCPAPQRAHEMVCCTEAIIPRGANLCYLRLDSWHAGRYIY